jgi:hypothetical protein
MIKKQEGLFESQGFAMALLSRPLCHSEPAAPLGYPPHRGRWAGATHFDCVVAENGDKFFYLQ